MKLIKDEFLLFGLPIKIKGLGTIYQPVLKDYIDNNIDIQNFIGLFNIKIDLLVENSEGLKNFDFFLVQMAEKGNLLIYQLIKYLKLLYRTNDVEFISSNDLNSIGILIKTNEEEIFINRENYDKLADVVSIILNKGNNIKEKENKKELDALDLEFAKRRREFEKKKAKKEVEKKKENSNDSLTFLDIVNYIIHTDNSQYNYNNILNLTVYQIMNTYNLYQMKEVYKTNMDYRTSGNFKIEGEVVHWFFNKK